MTIREQDLQLPTTWICDTCRQPIKSVEDGWVEWIVYPDANDEYRGRDIRIVHHMPASPRKQRPGCQFDEEAEHAKDRGIVNDLELSRYVGHDGLMELLSMLDGKHTLDSITEIIKRVHIPGYEHARHHFAEAIAEGVFEPNTRDDFYWQSEIAATLDYVRRKEPPRPQLAAPLFATV